MDETRVNGVQILPRDPLKRAHCRMIAEIINSGMQPYQNVSVLKRIRKEMGAEKREEWLKFYLGKGMRSLETTLRETSGKYCVGDEVTMADLCLVPQIFHAKRNKLDMSAQTYPTLNAVNNELEKLSAFK